jgi:beta-mannosidase
MACNFGWDWGPELVTCGIWRAIRLESWSGTRIAAVRPLTGLLGETGVLDVHVEIDGDAAVPVTVELRDGDARLVARGAGRGGGPAHLEVPQVRRWWPAGLGEQAQYALTVAHQDGRPTWRGRIGFRTVELDTTPDRPGTAFRLSVNGTALFVRGFNWIPDDCFPSRVDAGRYRRRLTQAREANANLIRVWGGGIYESDEFYRICDELGLLVWQDFPFACAAYAEEEPLWSEVADEARQAVTRLSPHPSLALYCGGNETIWGHQDWGWREVLGQRSWGWGYYTRLLPGIVRELDPIRPYLPSSPYSFRTGVHPNDPAHGATHIWDVWNRRDYTGYRSYRPRFVAEFGFQGPPAWSTLIRVIGPGERDIGSAAVLAHQKAADGMRKLADGLRPHLPAPRTFDDWHWAMSLNQARAISLGVEHFRSLAPECAGAIVWQLNDCWPVISWSAVDGDGRRKPMWYALRRCFAPRLLTIQPRDDGLSLLAVNDDTGEWRDTVRVSHRRLDGGVIAVVEHPIAVRPGLVQRVRLPFEPVEPARELLLAESGQRQAWWYFAEDVDADYPPPDIAAEVTAVPDGYRVAVTARSFVRDLALLADRAAADAEVDDMLVTLLPGQTAVFSVRTAAPLDAAVLTAPPVLRSANDLHGAGVPRR